MTLASGPEPTVEVRRSKRRRRTVSAYRDGEKIVVLIPASMTRKQEAEWVEAMVARVVKSERRAPPTDAELMDRALTLNDKYLGGMAVPGSVRWVDNQKQRWGSCTPGDRTIRLSARLQGMPAWVIDYVLVHELAHLLEPGHDAAFWGWVDRYPQVERANVTALETKWARASFDGKPHEHTFVLDSNGKWFARVSATRDSAAIESGVDGFTFMKSTGSGWESYVMDSYTTLPETKDRMCAPSMESVWRWSREPASFPAANAAILDTALKVFATTYSEGVQASLYRMGMAVLEAVPEVAQIHMACPNKHYILVNLSPFGLENNNQVFLPTDEPHGQIECAVGRD